MDWQDSKALKHLQDSGFFDSILVEHEKRFLGGVAALSEEQEILSAVTEYKIATQVINQLAMMPTTTGD